MSEQEAVVSTFAANPISVGEVENASPAQPAEPIRFALAGYQFEMPLASFDRQDFYCVAEAAAPYVRKGMCRAAFELKDSMSAVEHQALMDSTMARVASLRRATPEQLMSFLQTEDGAAVFVHALIERRRPRTLTVEQVKAALANDELTTEQAERLTAAFIDGTTRPSQLERAQGIG